MMVALATLVYASLLIAFGFHHCAVAGRHHTRRSRRVGRGGNGDAADDRAAHHVGMICAGAPSASRPVSAMTANNLGTFEVGVMSDLIGADRTLILGGAVGIAVVLIVWLTVRGIREYRYPAD